MRNASPMPPRPLRLASQNGTASVRPRSRAGLKWIRFVRMSCDTSAMLPVIEQATAYLKEAGVQSWRFWCYVLVQDVEESHNRIIALRDMGVQPFAQPYRDYDGGEPTDEQKNWHGG